MPAKFRYFQFRLNNMILGSAEYTAKMGYTTDKCMSCERRQVTAVETLTHLITGCPQLQELWEGLQEWEPFTMLDPDLTNKNILLWHKKEDKGQDITINIVLVLVKYYIFKCKLSSQQPRIGPAKIYIKKYCNWISQSLTIKKKKHYLDLFVNDNYNNYVSLRGKILPIALT